MLSNQLLTQKMWTAKQWQEAHFYTIELVLMQYNHAQFWPGHQDHEISLKHLFNPELKYYIEGRHS